MPIQNSMVRHTLLLSLASVWMRSVSMLFQVWLSRRMGAAGIGLLQLINTVGFFALTLGTAGVRVASMYLVAQQRGHRSPSGMRQATGCCLRYVLFTGLAAGGLLFLGAPVIADRLLTAPEAAGPLQIFALFLPVSCLTAVLGGWFTACVKIKTLTQAELAVQLGVLVTAALLLSRSQTPAQCCCAIGLANGLGDLSLLLILSLLYRRAQVGIPRQPAPGLGRQLLGLALPLAGSDLLRSGLSTTEQLLIPWGLTAYGLDPTGGRAAYGMIQGMVFPILMFPATLLGALGDLLVPELARCTAAGSHTRVRYLTGRCLQLGLLFAAGMAGLLLCIGPPLAALLYDEPQAVRYVALFAPLVLMLYLDAVTDAMLKGLGQQVASVRYNCLTSALDILLLLVTLPQWGMDGYFWSFTITHGINLLLSLKRLFQTAHTALPPAFCLRVIGIAATALFPVQALSGSLHPCAAICLGLIGYPSLLLLLLRLTNTLSGTDLRWLRQLLG